MTSSRRRRGDSQRVARQARLAFAAAAALGIVAFVAVVLPSRSTAKQASASVAIPAGVPVDAAAMRARLESSTLRGVVARTTGASVGALADGLRLSRVSRARLTVTYPGSGAAARRVVAAAAQQLGTESVRSAVIGSQRAARDAGAAADAADAALAAERVRIGLADPRAASDAAQAELAGLRARRDQARDAGDLAGASGLDQTIALAQQRAFDLRARATRDAQLMRAAQSRRDLAENAARAIVVPGDGRLSVRDASATREAPLNRATSLSIAIPALAGAVALVLVGLARRRARPAAAARVDEDHDDEDHDDEDRVDERERRVAAEAEPVGVGASQESRAALLDEGPDLFLVRPPVEQIIDLVELERQLRELEDLEAAREAQRERDEQRARAAMIARRALRTPPSSRRPSDTRTAEPPRS